MASGSSRGASSARMLPSRPREQERQARRHVAEEEGLVLRGDPRARLRHLGAPRERLGQALGRVDQRIRSPPEAVPGERTITKTFSKPPKVRRKRR